MPKVTYGFIITPILTCNLCGGSTSNQLLNTDHLVGLISGSGGGLSHFATYQSMLLRAI